VDIQNKVPHINKLCARPLKKLGQFKRVTEEQTISWIFLATAIASGTEPSDFKSISEIADGINHAVPTHKELKSSMTWLTTNGLVNRNGNKYSLTDKGKSDYEIASKPTETLLKIWDNVESLFKKYRV